MRTSCKREGNQQCCHSEGFVHVSPRIDLSEEETQLVEQLLREEVEKGLGSTSFRTTNPHETFL
jgi:hypothetical protein